jgi:ABC-type branched-subunit amino acid transport system ATPase component
MAHSATASQPLLRVVGLSKSFGGLLAVAGVSFEVGGGEIVGVVGPNGAGKTTLFNLVSGYLTPDSGEILLQGRTLAGLPPHKVATLGIARTFQSLQVFSHMTTLENIKVGRHLHSRSGLLAAALRTAAARAEERRVEREARAALERIGLDGRADQLAGNLSFGEQRRLEIARALAAEPRLLLLDEPAAGLTQQEKADLAEVIRQIQGQGVSVLLVEHDVQMVMGLAVRVLVLDYGQLIAMGPPEQVQADPRVIEAYLGAGWGQGDPEVLAQSAGAVSD